MPGRCLKAPACPSCTTISSCTICNLRRLTKSLLAVVRLPFKFSPCAIHCPSPLSLMLSQPLESAWTCPCGPLSLHGSRLRASALHSSPATCFTSLSLFPHELHSRFTILRCHSMPALPLDSISLCFSLSAWQLLETLESTARASASCGQRRVMSSLGVSFVQRAPVMCCVPCGFPFRLPSCLRAPARASFVSRSACAGSSSGRSSQQHRRAHWMQQRRRGRGRGTGKGRNKPHGKMTTTRACIGRWLPYARSLSRGSARIPCWTLEMTPSAQVRPCRVGGILRRLKISPAGL